MIDWGELSASEKAEFMRIAIKGGVNKLDDIRELYNSYRCGGNINKLRNGGEKKRRKMYNVVKERIQEQSNQHAQADKPLPLRGEEPLQPMGYNMMQYTPVVGDALQAGEAATAAAQGEYGKAALLGGLLLLPNAIDKPIKKGLEVLKQGARSTNIRNTSDLYKAAENVIKHGNSRNQYLKSDFAEYPEFAEFLRRNNLEPSQEAIDKFAKQQGLSVRGVRVPEKTREYTYEDWVNYLSSHPEETKTTLDDFLRWKYDVNHHRELTNSERDEVAKYFLTHSPYSEKSNLIADQFEIPTGADILGSNGIYSSNSLSVANYNAFPAYYKGVSPHIGLVETSLIYDKSLPFEQQLDQIGSQIFNYDDVLDGAFNHKVYGYEPAVSTAAQRAGYRVGDHEYAEYFNGNLIHERTTLDPNEDLILNKKIKSWTPDDNRNKYGLGQHKYRPLDNQLFIPKVTTERDIEKIADLLSWLENSYGDPLFKDGGGIHIKPSHRGRFTALQERTGKSASWYKAHGTPAQRKMATFALNARKWHHGDGGNLINDDEEYYGGTLPAATITGRLPEVQSPDGKAIARNMAERMVNGDLQLKDVPRRYQSYVQGEAKGAIPMRDYMNKATNVALHGPFPVRHSLRCRQNRQAGRAYLWRALSLCVPLTIPLYR